MLSEESSIIKATLRSSSMRQPVKVEILGNSYECVHANGTLWFTQKTLGRILGATKQNISLYTQELANDKSAQPSIQLAVSQIEGKRVITRDLAHFSIEILAAIALRSRRLDIYDEVTKVASAHDVTLAGVPVQPRKERDFGELLLGALLKITPVVEQQKFGTYYADFYLPEFSLVVEYDEPHHLSPNRQRLDSARQSLIEDTYGVTFLRIGSNREIEGLNQVLRIVYARNQQGKTCE
jgi:very-short-patch-repair endonuclease